MNTQQTHHPARWLTALFPFLVAACAGATTSADIAAPTSTASVADAELVVGGPPQTADLVLTGGKIVTMDPANPQAEALAIIGNRIAAVGSEETIGAYYGPNTRVIELDGRLAIPSFIEGHGHFMGLGRAQMILDLTTARSWDEIVAMVEEAAEQAEPGEWILGRGWHQEKWDQPPSPSVEGNPTHAALSQVSPENPVFLTHASGHASFVNAAAMERAGIAPNTQAPEGGEIVHDEAGEPTGLLRENAQDMVEEAIGRSEAQRSPEAREADLRRAVELAGQEALSKGVTSFHDAGTSFQTIDFLKQLADEGKLPLRLYVMTRYADNDELARKLPEYRMIGYGDDYLTVRSIKRQIDGALGSHGAWLLEPYNDLPRSTGLVLESPEEIERTAELAIEHGYQVNTHAIGDRANREVLDIYERVFREEGVDGDTLRWRIEHAQHLNPADIPRFADLGVIAAMQGVHATSDAPWVPAKLGDKRAEEGAYVWQTLWDQGVIVTNGTDVPVEDIDPIQSFYASVSRRTADGSVFYPAQRMTREQALQSYTLNNAIAAFEEDIKGSLEAGKLADIVVLSEDIMTVPEEQISDAAVVYTILGGEVVYRNPELTRESSR